MTPHLCHPEPTAGAQTPTGSGSTARRPRAPQAPSICQDHRPPELCPSQGRPGGSPPGSARVPALSQSQARRPARRLTVSPAGVASQAGSFMEPHSEALPEPSQGLCPRSGNLPTPHSRCPARSWAPEACAHPFKGVSLNSLSPEGLEPQAGARAALTGLPSWPGRLLPGAQPVLWRYPGP